MQMNRKRVTRVWGQALTRMSCALVLCLSFAAFGHAQEGGTIVGTVTDQTGGVIPGAQVTITNQATGNVIRSAMTNSAGNYIFAALPVSTYTVKVEKQGFTTQSHTDLALDVRAEVRVDFTMAVGQVSVEVNVVASSVHLQTENAAVSDTITAHHVEALDINGRNFVQLATLVPGASGGSLVGSVNTPVGVTANTGIAFNGMRVSHNVWSVDGVENYDRGCGGCIEVVPDQDAIQEFKVLSSNAQQDLGFGSAAHIQMEIKSGGNKFHGEAFEFNRNRVLEAGNFFTNKAGQHNPYDNQNDFGFNLGGPIGNPAHENKSFFFVTMDWRRFLQGLSYNVNGIFQPWTTGDFSANSAPILDLSQPAVACTDSTGAAQKCYPQISNGTTANVIPAAALAGSTYQLDPNALILGAPSQGVFLPPNAASGKLIAGYTQPTHVSEQIFRFDHTFSEKTSLMAHYIRDNIVQQIPRGLWTGGTYADMGTNFANEPESLALKLTHSISPTLLNESLVAFNRQPLTLTDFGVFKLPSGITIKKIFPGNDPANRIPNINIGGTLGINYTTGSWPWWNVLNTWTWRDSMTWIKGNHTLNFGFEDLHYMKQQRLFGQTNGAYSFNASATAGYMCTGYPACTANSAVHTAGNAFADFMVGQAFSYNELQSQPTPAWINNHIGLFIGDAWKVRSGLTVNAGLRWEGMPHAYERHNQIGVFRPAFFSPTTAAADYNAAAGNFGGNFNILGKPFYTNGLGSPNPAFNLPAVSRGLVQNHWNLFEPRFGFAWQPKPGGKIVIRGGAALYYENTQGNDVYNAGGNPPVASTPNVFKTTLSNPGGGALPLGSPGSIQAYEVKYPQQYSWQWNFGAEYAFNQRTLFSLAYVGNKSTHQSINLNINQPQPSPTAYAVLNSARPYLGWSNINFYSNEANANYNSLQANLRFSSWHGLTTGAVYTWSHCLDETDGDLNSVPNSYNLSREYGNCGYDIRNMMVINYIYSLPFFNQAQGFERTALGGWQVSGITTLYSKYWLTIGSSGGDLANCNCGGYRADLIGNPNSGTTGTVASWFNTAAFQNAALGTFGTSGRNNVPGGSIDNFDFSIFKNFAGIPLPKTKEGGALQLRFEFYNLFNHTQFNGFDTTVGDRTFGQATSAKLGRQIQIGAKLTF